MYDLRYLTLLSREYKNVQAVSAEIINLQAICNLPKGTEHFLSDIHGEHLAFLHIMNNASGVIREKIDLIFEGTLLNDDRRELATLIYYPEKKLERIKLSTENMEEWYRITLYRLVNVCLAVTHKYSRSKVRKALPNDFAYVIDELLNTNYVESDRDRYYENIIKSIIDLDRADAFIIALCNLIKSMAVDTLHILGDIFDRGPHADVIIDKLMTHHNVDIEWGNHDVLFMGAASGSSVCVATVVKNCLQYDNLDMLENSYGINLLPLALFAAETYENANVFSPRVSPDVDYKPKDGALFAKMHKAICIIMFKLEGQLIKRNPDYKMMDRDLLSRVNFDDMTVDINGISYKLRDVDFPTIDKKNPTKLSQREETVLSQLVGTFLASDKLQKHIRYIYGIGSVYKKCNDNLLFHGCIPLNKNGSFMEFTFDGCKYKGKELLEYCEKIARSAYFSKEGSIEKQRGGDFLWYLWCGRNSPIFGRDHISTFERTLIADENTWIEPKNYYYTYCDDMSFCERLLLEFSIDNGYSHIINGHMPVKVKDGESPIRAGGKRIVIDGGFCKAYQKTTGIAGYTMFFSSHGLRIAAHEPFCIKNEDELLKYDIPSQESVLEENLNTRLMVADTDVGRELMIKIDELKGLLQAYRDGTITYS
ncbi:MAG: fructose-1,6-bisphosphatase [Clostridia bacterium]